MGIIGPNIKRIRKEKGITQKQLGEMLNISQAAIGQFESEKSNPKIETLEKIAACLSVPVAEFLSIHSEKDYDIMTADEWELRGQMCSVEMSRGPIMDITLCFTKLNEKAQQKVADYAKDLCSIDQYLKDYWKIKK